MKRIKVKMILFFSFSIALGAIAGFVHSASSLIEASAPSNPGTTIAPTTGSKPEIEKKEEQAKQATNDSTTQESSAPVSQSKEVPKKTNIVESGQTLWEIAQNNGLTIQQIMNQNQLTSTAIVEGQEIIIEK